ncbi:MAG: hypothetical protein KBT12_02870 [Bacteroidales bacterium]|nr:hypothetical protein [Candidatus Physcousia equi]
MKLNKLATQQTKGGLALASNHAYYAAYEEHGNELLLVIRPHARFLGNEDYMEAFRYLGPLTQSFTHPAILRCEEYGEDFKGPYWVLTQGRFQSIEQALSERISLRFNKTWINRFAILIARAVQYLNKEHELALELLPSSILLTRDGNHVPVLLPPLSPFLSVKSLVFEDDSLCHRKADCLPPELFNAESPDARTDVFGIGQLIRSILPSSQLPHAFRKAVRLATLERIDLRPTSPAAFMQLVKRARVRERIKKTVICALVVLGIFALIVWCPWRKGSTTDITYVQPAEEVHMHASDVGRAPDSSNTRVVAEVAHHGSPADEDERQFCAAFRMQVQTILKRVYTPELLANEEAFMRASEEANAHIINIGERLAAQFHIDPSTAKHLAAEVYDEVAEELTARK